jgi:rRNA maturation RNase YbeY
MAITFHNADIKFTLPEKARMKAFLKGQLSGNPDFKSFLTFIFCSDEYLLQINRQFLNHDYYTDIITFPLVQGEKYLEAEIYISIDRVRENAAKYNSGKSLPRKAHASLVTGGINGIWFDLELRRVIFHGVLHLLGYGDKTKAEKAEMRRMENLWLKRYTRATKTL